MPSVPKMSTLDTEVAGNTDSNIITSPLNLAYVDTHKRSRGWMIVINNPVADEMADLADRLDYIYLIYQMERGESGTEHLQGFVYFENAKAMKVLKKNHYCFFRAHLEPVRDIAATIKYSSKEDTRIAGPWEFGTKPQQGKRNDLVMIVEEFKARESIEQFVTLNGAAWVKYHKGLQSLAYYSDGHREEKPYVMWIYGDAGKGKTKFCVDKHPTSHYIKDGTQWWDGYEHEEAIIIDDFDGKWPYRDFLRLLDRYKYQGQYKGGYIKINSPFIYITCEYPPRDINEWTFNDNTLEQILRRIDCILNLNTNHMFEKV